MSDLYLVNIEQTLHMEVVKSNNLVKENNESKEVNPQPILEGHQRHYGKWFMESFLRNLIGSLPRPSTEYQFCLEEHIPPKDLEHFLILQINTCPPHH